MTYMYCSLDSLDEGSKLNIYGVVISFRYYNDARNPSYEQQNQHKLVVKLIDQTVCKYSDHYTAAVEVSLYSDRKQNLPVINAVGDILRIHRIKGRKVGDRIVLEGKIGVSGCHAVVWPQTFEYEEEEYDYLFSTGKTFTITNADKQMIDDLRKLFTKVRPTTHLDVRGKLAGILRGSYGDVIVQVIGRIKTTRGSVVLRVWDGSQHRNELPLRINEVLEINRAESDFDEQLNRIAGPRGYDIFVYDEWKAVCQEISAKDIICIRNLHLAFNKSSTTFMMHRDTTGGAHQRGIDKLPADDQRTVDLLSDLQKWIDAPENADRPASSSDRRDDQEREATATAQPPAATQNGAAHTGAVQNGEAASTSRAATSTTASTTPAKLALKQSPGGRGPATTAAAAAGRTATTIRSPMAAVDEARSSGVVNLDDSADSLAAALEAESPPVTPPGRSPRRNGRVEADKIVRISSDDDDEDEVTASQEPQPVYRLRRMHVVLHRFDDPRPSTSGASVQGSSPTKRVQLSRRAKLKRAKKTLS